MKKIGIITINDYTNYGNRLQNYAVSNILSSMEFEVTTIVNSPIDKKNGITSWIKKNVKYFVKLAIGRKTIDDKRLVNFKKFTRKYIPETNYTVYPNDIPKNLNEEYNYFVVGSDQVWNPDFRLGSKIDFLNFADNDKKISFSASFGLSSIPDKYKELYKKELVTFSHLSVREERGKEIIKELSGGDATVLVDPTMLLKSEDWEELIDLENLEEENDYILTYFLGEKSKDTQQTIDELSKKYNKKVINLNDKSHPEYFAIDPASFINYIKNTDLFFTDSFHGVVFSIIFKTNFVICSRVNKGGAMNSRIDTLLSKFHLEYRSWENLKEVSSEDFFDNYYTEEIDYILDEERKKAGIFLNQALK